MSRGLEIIIIVLVALGAGAALYFAYPYQVSLVAGEARSYVLSLNQPAGPKRYRMTAHCDARNT